MFAFEISPWLIYFWGQADAIRDIACPIAGFSVAALAFSLILSFVLDEDAPALAESCRKPLIYVIAVSLLIQMFMPTSKTIAMVVVIPAIVNLDPIQKDLPELYKMGVDALKGSIQEATKAEK